jgi:hypothetical protein
VRVRVIFGKEKGPEVIGLVARDVVSFHGRGDQRFESAFLQRGVSSEPREHTAAEGIQYDGLGVLPGTTPAARGGREPLIVIKSRLQTRWLATRLADGSHDGL